jgi:hypothetical protein
MDPAIRAVGKPTSKNAHEPSDTLTSNTSPYPKISQGFVHRSKEQIAGGIPMKNRKDPMRKREDQDIWLYRMIVATLGLTVVASVVGAVTLAMTGESAPEILVALGSAAIGGLAGFLVPNHFNR